MPAVHHYRAAAAALALLLVLLAGCTTAPKPAAVSSPDEAQQPLFDQTPAPAGAPSTPPTLVAPVQLPTRLPGQPGITPTPDAPRVLPTMRSQPKEYTVQAGDTLNKIASANGIGLNDIITANQITNPNLLSIGQVLTVPPPTPKAQGPGNKLFPDSELVYGPVNAFFDIRAYIQGQPGSLKTYTEELNGRTHTGAQVVQRIAQEYSVNPRLLLALLEYRTGFLTNPQPSEEAQRYPLAYPDTARPGLYRQLAWAANQLNSGYYLWRVNAVSHYILSDTSYVPPDPTINAGTAGVQVLMARFFGYEEWLKAVSPEGFVQTFVRLFGSPFDVAIEPLAPDNLQQPPLQLPFERGVAWSFTGGPHGGWGDGSAWAALDFAPPGEAVGCVLSDAWVTAMADGPILRAGDGEVIQDLDGDGLEETGWVALYLHIDSKDRVQAGAQLKAGDRIGHPSCEGGVSSGTHVHIARRYNGEWIPADGKIPFDLGGWVSQGYGSEYDGILSRDGESIEAWSGRRPENQIAH